METMTESAATGSLFGGDGLADPVTALWSLWERTPSTDREEFLIRVRADFLKRVANRNEATPRPEPGQGPGQVGKRRKVRA
jgi:hypothetical protein